MLRVRKPRTRVALRQQNLFEMSQEIDMPCHCIILQSRCTEFTTNLEVDRSAIYEMRATEFDACAGAEHVSDSPDPTGVTLLLNIFEILSRFRAILPHRHRTMMNEETVNSCGESLSILKAVRMPSTLFPRPTQAEASICSLCADANQSIEQERLPWQVVVPEMAKTAVLEE